MREDIGVGPAYQVQRRACREKVERGLRNIRAPFRRLIEDRLPEVGVFAHEATAGFQLQEIARISMAESAPV